LPERRAIIAALIAPLIAAMSIGTALGSAAISAAAKSPSRHGTAAKLSPALKRELSRTANQHVIVILKSQMRAARVGSRTAAARVAAIRAAQAPVVRQLKSVRAQHIKSSSCSTRSRRPCPRASGRSWPETRPSPGSSPT
jgi:alpha-ketoglutarate-dependent taurine dioxygenase